MPGTKLRMFRDGFDFKAKQEPLQMRHFGDSHVNAIHIFQSLQLNDILPHCCLTRVHSELDCIITGTVQIFCLQCIGQTGVKTCFFYLTRMFRLLTASLFPSAASDYQKKKKRPDVMQTEMSLITNRTFVMVILSLYLLKKNSLIRLKKYFYLIPFVLLTRRHL